MVGCTDTTKKVSGSASEGDYDPRPFLVGDIVASRYVVSRKIGEGGMGAVYEVQDLELGERVALKTLLRVEESEGGLEGLKRELQLARKVTHPNVCRVFDVGYHPPARAGGAPVIFLTMELLSGETLGQRLHRAGPMSTSDALPLLIQMVAGLSAAHDAGIVHRDFKPDNVLLVPVAPKEADSRDRTATSGVRAVVTDFSIARGLAEEVSASGRVVGTPHYMAPEQVEAKGVTPATDVYALGVVMFEMVTGQLPFTGKTALAIAAARLQDEPVRPRTIVPTLERRWEETILRCLQRDPTRRFARANQVPLALVDRVTLSRGGTAPASDRRRLAFVGVSVAAIAAAGVGAWLGIRMPERVEPIVVGKPAPEAVAPAARRSVAVLGFKNLSGRAKADWLSVAFSETLAGELAAGAQLRVVPGEQVARMRSDLALADPTSMGPEDLARARRHLGADILVTGSYLAAGDRVQLVAKLLGASEAAPVVVTQAGTEAGLVELVSAAGAKLRRELGLSASSGRTAALPAKVEAARLYSEGLSRLFALDALAARDLLTKAASLEPAFPLTHGALADAWAELGYDARARESAKAALDRAATLGREERLAVEARYYKMARQWDRAIESYRQLWTLAPDTLEYGLKLAEAQILARKSGDAMATVESLRALPSPARDDPRIDLTEAEVSEKVSDFKRELVAANRAAAKAEKQGARTVLARARLLESWANMSLGDLAVSVAKAQEAERICVAAGYRNCAATAMRAQGMSLLRQGNPAEALKRYEDALAVYRDIGNERAASNALVSMANAQLHAGNVGRARESYEGALATCRRAGDRLCEATVLFNLGNAYGREGDVKRAVEHAEASLEVARELGDKSKMAAALVLLADIQRLQGERARAQSAAEEALALSRAIGLAARETEALELQALLLRDGGDLVAARQRAEEALAVNEKGGAVPRAAETRMLLATIALDEGKASEAEALARKALGSFVEKKSADIEGQARAILGRALAAQGNAAEALAEAKLAEAIAGKSQDRRTAQETLLQLARLYVGADKRDAAVKALLPLLDEARKHGNLHLELEARLALCQIDAATGGAARPGTRGRCSVLEKDASARGYAFIAGKAAEAAKKTAADP